MRGRLLAVIDEPSGSQLAVAYDPAGGNKVMQLVDVIDFGEEGGALLIGTESGSYTRDALSDNANTITLDNALSQVWPAGTRVTYDPPPTTRVAHVHVDEVDEEITTARVPYTMYGLLPTGIRSVTEQEAVVLDEDADGVMYLYDIIGVEPRIAGEFITPGTVPPTGDGEVPPDPVSPPVINRQVGFNIIDLRDHPRPSDWKLFEVEVQKSIDTGATWKDLSGNADQWTSLGGQSALFPHGPLEYPTTVPPDDPDVQYRYRFRVADTEGLFSNWSAASSGVGTRRLNEPGFNDVTADSITADHISTLVLDAAKIFSPGMTGKRLEIGDEIFPLRHWDGTTTYFSLAQGGDVYVKGRVDFGLGSGLLGQDIIELLEQPSSFANPTRVQAPVSVGGTSDTQNPVYSQPTVAGNTLVAICGMRSSVTATITPPNGNWLTAKNNINVVGTDAKRVAVFYYPNAPSMTDPGVWTASSLSEHFGVILLEMAGLGTLDQTAEADGNSTSPASGTTPTTTQTHEWCLAAVITRNETPTNWTNSFTLVKEQAITFGMITALERVVTATGAYGTTGTATTGVWAGVIVTFRAAAAAVTTPATNKNRLYAKDKGGVSALYAINDAGTETPIVGSTAHTKEAMGSADQGLTTSDVTATGASITLDKNGRWLIWWSCHPDGFTGTFIGKLKIDGVQAGKEVRAWQAAGSVTLHMSHEATVTAQPDTALVTVTSTSAGGNNRSHGTMIRALYLGV